MSTKKLQILDSLIKQAENADTLDGKHASDFAAASDVEALQTQVENIQKNAYDDTEVRGLISDNASDIDTLEGLVGDTSVAEQISEALGDLPGNGTLEISSGGTSATDAATALVNLGITSGQTEITAGATAMTPGSYYFVYE